MDRMETRLAAIAKKLEAAITVKDRLANAQQMIRDGGRGIALGVREIGYLASDMKDLADQMRRIQAGYGPGEEAMMQTDLLGALSQYTGRF